MESLQHRSTYCPPVPEQGSLLFLLCLSITLLAFLVAYGDSNSVGDETSPKGVFVYVRERKGESGKAPQPTPRHLFRNSVPDGGGTSAIDYRENILRPTVDFQLTLPRGYQVSVTEDRSKALMDLLVDLCGRHHLNPSLHTLELLSPEGHSLGFKPNALLGSFNVACVLIKEKVVEDKVTRRPAPKVPEGSVAVLSAFDPTWPQARGQHSSNNCFQSFAVLSLHPLDFFSS
ncbi:hypothetical protein CRENBAI_001963 [Crenichthys baileyi]|uniref:Uncharacterized protein n=1 Tax=Crenichthys baileyi TaxID=28760 RepID=A0AAV9RGZ6_9TELE